MFSDNSSVSIPDTSMSTPTSSSSVASFGSQIVRSTAEPEWDSFSSLPSNQEMILSPANFALAWEPHSQPPTDQNQYSSFSDHTHAFPDFMLLDPNFSVDYPIGDAFNNNSYCWQGSSDFDPGIFFFPTPRNLDPPALPYLLDDNMYPDFTEQPLVKATDQLSVSIPKAPDNFHTITFSAGCTSPPKETTLTVSNLELSHNSTSISQSESASDDETPEITPWSYAERTPRQKDMTSIAISVGTGEKSRQITFSSKADLVAKLKKLIPDTKYAFNVSGFARGMEGRVTFCRASYERKRVSKRLEEITYLEVRRSLKMKF